MYLVVSVLVGFSVLAAQRVYQRNLAEQAGMVEKKVARLQAGLLRHSKENLATTARGEGLRSGEADFRSEERIEAATFDVEDFLNSAGDMRSPDLFMKALPGFLLSIGNLNAEELLTVVTRMGGDGSSEGLAEAGKMITGILLSLAGEIGSEGMWDHLSEMNGETQEALFSSLAKKDPETAMKWLKEQNLPSSTRDSMARSLVLATLAQDPIAALGMMRELGSGWEEYQQGLPLRLDEGQVSQLESAFKEPDNTDLKEQIALVLMTSASSGGVASLKQQAERLELDEGELGTFFARESLYRTSEMGEFLSWMVESLPQDNPELRQMVFNTTQQWANRDFGATAEWLGELKPSNARDSAIEGFVYSVAQLDPEAAAQWALEVKGSKKRETILSYAMKAWRRKDAAAADSWLERREGELKVSE